MKSPLIPIAAACALWLSAVVAAAQPAPPSSQPPRPTSLEQAVKQVQHTTHGHILAADSIPRGRNTVYRIKVLTPQGQVKVVQLHSPPRSTKSGKHDSDQGGH